MKLIKIIFYITLIYILSIISISIFVKPKIIEVMPLVIITRLMGDYDNLQKLVTGNIKGLTLFDIVTNYFILIIVTLIIYLLYKFKKKIKRKSYLFNWL